MVIGIYFIVHFIWFLKMYIYSSSQLAQDALELCDYLEWDKFHVVAISMGILQTRYN